MKFTKKRNVTIFIMVLVAICIGLARSGFSGDERAGLYAGPLSVVVETVVEKARSASKDVPEPPAGASQPYRGETGGNKKRANEPESKSPLSSPSTPRTQ